MAWRAGEWVLLAVGALAMASPCLTAAATPTAAPAVPAIATLEAKPAKPIDINSASRTQLKSLPGIGDAEAQKIIAHRPYHSKADLVTKNVLPAGVYQSIRHQIIAIQPGPPPPGKHP